MGVTMTRDARGAEQRTETGVGRIIKVEPKGERNVRVEILADHLREPVSGWVDRQGPVWPRVQAAHADGRPVWYRVDVHRKGSVSVDVPLADVAKREKVRDLVGIEMPQDAPQVVADAPHADGGAPGPTSVPTELDRPAAARTAPPRDMSHAERDEVDAARAAAVRELENYLVGEDHHEPVQLLGLLRRHHEVLGWNGLVQVLQRTGCTWELMRPDEQHQSPWLRPLGNRPTRERPAQQPQQDAAARAAAAALAQRRDPDRVGERAPATQSMPDAQNGTAPTGRAVSATSGLSRQRQAVATDGKPWDVVNSDGRTNLGSYAAGAVIEITNLAARLLVTRARNRHDEALMTGQPSVLQAPTEKGVTSLARSLLRMADTIQVTVRGGRVDRMSGSHKVCRQALREGLDLYPVPWGAEAAEVEDWERSVIAHGTLLVTVAVGILEQSGDDFRTD